MSNSYPIFGTHAPEYWENKFSVFFVELGTKSPPKISDAKGWTGFCNNLPNEKMRNYWLTKYSNCGIALLTGMEIKAGYRIAAVDVDDDQLVRPVKAVLGNCPCAKRGKKGMTFFVLSEANLKSTVLKDVSSAPKVDILINGKMTVIPPTIHPDTGKPYEWHGKPLLECSLDELPILTVKKLKCLEHIIKSEHTPVLLKGETTHEAGYPFIGMLVAIGCDDEFIETVFSAMLPEGYDGNSFQELSEWIQSARSKGFANAAAASGPFDDKIAALIAEELKPLVYVAGEGFLRYKDGHWQNFSDSAFDRLAKQLVTPYLRANQQVSQFLFNIRKCAMLNLEREGFGDYSSKICLKNGTLDVGTGELLEWSPEHELRYQLNFNYDPEAKCPLYEEQVHETLCNDEKAVAAFEEFAGLTLIPDLSMQKALYFVGTGGSGKSTLLRLVESMHCPEAVSVTPLDKIDSERYLTNLARKLVCISFDIQTKQRVFGESFVRITGGDLITTRKLYNEVEGRVKPTVRFMGSMNPDMPRFIASPDALERRLIFLKCGHKVAKPDRNRFDKLLQERAGILNRWIKALQRLLERGEFELPQNSILEVDEYVKTQDAVQVFVRDHLVLDSSSNTPAGMVLDEYNIWADAANEKRLSANVLGKKLKAFGVKMEYGSINLPGLERRSVRMYKVKFRRDAPFQESDY